MAETLPFKDRTMSGGYAEPGSAILFLGSPVSRPLCGHWPGPEQRGGANRAFQPARERLSPKGKSTETLRKSTAEDEPILLSLNKKHD